MRRTSSYPTEDGLNFAGIDFPTPVSQIGRLERQNPNLAINVFGWENDRVIVHRISEKDGEIPRINLMLVKTVFKRKIKQTLFEILASEDYYIDLPVIIQKVKLNLFSS